MKSYLDYIPQELLELDDYPMDEILGSPNSALEGDSTVPSESSPLTEQPTSVQELLVRSLTRLFDESRSPTSTSLYTTCASLSDTEALALLGLAATMLGDARLEVRLASVAAPSNSV